MTEAPRDTRSTEAGMAGGDRSNMPIFTVAEISLAVKNTVEGAFSRVRIRGEISRPSFPSSGHCYFRLKDENAVIDSVVWRGTLSRLALRPEDGLEVIASGRLTTYAGKSSYQIIVDSLELAGEGALLKLLEERRKALAAEGLFADDRKRRLPFLPEVIGVVTSPTGSVIRDILHRLADRFPRHVLVWPVAVQGDQAAQQVATAIEGFNALPRGGPIPRPDVLIVARGGGSLEDLWAFNEEVAVRAAAASAIPLISAVGHETDTTLMDFAADRRAPTPTAAAEIAVPVKSELVALALELERRLVAAGYRGLDERRTRVEGLARGLSDPARLLQEKAQRMDDSGERLALAVEGRLRHLAREVEGLGWRLPRPEQQLRLANERLAAASGSLFQAYRRTFERNEELYLRLDARRRLSKGLETARAEAEGQVAQLERLLESYSYQKTLRRGYAVVHSGERVITRKEEVSPGQGVEIEFADGRVPAVTATGKPRAEPRRRGRGSSGDGKQGSLL